LGKAVVKEEGGKLFAVEVNCLRMQITDVKISGDFFAYPEELVERVEEALRGASLNEGAVTSALKGELERVGGTFVGVKLGTIVKAVLQAGSA
jgi:lipoate-protein ligase A